MVRTTYFDNAGNYGDAEGLVIYDSTSWTSDDYATLDWATNAERGEVAKAINVYHQQQGKPAAVTHSTERSK